MEQDLLLVLVVVLLLKLASLRH